MPICPAALVLALSLTAGDPPEWGGFRGNNGCGVSRGTAIPEALDKDVNLLWRMEVPPGFSSPIVTGDNVIVTGVEGKKLVTLCLDMVTGEIRWGARVDFDGTRVGANSSAAPTPATDGERVYALFHHVGMIAYDLDGVELWRSSLGAPFDIPHGLATSPVLHGDLVVVQIDQDSDSYLVAVDKASGKERWRVERPGATHSYATPVIYEPDEGPAEIICSGALQIAAYSVEDGEKLWWVDGSAWQTKSVPVIHGDLCIVNAYMVPTSEFGAPRITQSWEEALAERDTDGDELISRDEWPIPALLMAWFIFDLDGDDKLNEEDYEYLKLAGTAVGGLFAIRLGGRGDVSESHVAWRYEERRGLSDLVSPVVVGDTLFLLKDGGILTTVDAATGKTVKQGRIGDPDSYYASPIASGGRVLTASQAGQVSVISGEGEWEVISSADLDEYIWSTPALAGGLIFVRSQVALYAFFNDEG